MSTSPPPMWSFPSFRRVWLGQSAAMIGSQFGLLAFPLLAISSLNATAPQVAILSSATTLPFVFLSLFAGVLVDKIPRKFSLVLCSVLRGIFLLTIPIAAILDSLTLAHLLIVALIDGSLNVFWTTAYRSFLPQVVPRSRLSDAYALVGVSDGVSRTLSPSVVGFAVQILTAPWAIVVQAALFLTSSLAHSRVSSASQSSRDQSRPVSLAPGSKFLRISKVVRRLALAETTYQLFQGIAQGVLVFFLSRNLGLSAGAVGLLLSVGTIGGVLGALTSRRLGIRFGERRCVFVGCVARSVGLCVVAGCVLAGDYAPAVVVVGLLINGYGWTLYEVYQDTMQQRRIPDEIRGQVNGTVMFISMSGMFLGTLGASLLSGWIGVPLTVAVGAALCLLACAWVIPSSLAGATGENGGD